MNDGKVMLSNPETLKPFNNFTEILVSKRSIMASPDENQSYS